MSLLIFILNKYSPLSLSFLPSVLRNVLILWFAINTTWIEMNAFPHSLPGWFLSFLFVQSFTQSLLSLGALQLYAPLSIHTVCYYDVMDPHSLYMIIYNRSKGLRIFEFDNSAWNICPHLYGVMFVIDVIIFILFIASSHFLIRRTVHEFWACLWIESVCFYFDFCVASDLCFIDCVFVCVLFISLSGNDRVSGISPLHLIFVRVVYPFPFPHAPINGEGTMLKYVWCISVFIC